MAATARAIALRVLGDVTRAGETLADSLARPEAEALEPRDRSFLHELVLGTLRRRGLLDHALARAASRPLEKVAPGVLDALRLAAYQLLFTRVAPHAALSESVDLARSVEPRAAGFANAVLRRLQREGLPAEPDPAGDTLAWLTSFGSLPPWLAERWLARLGPERAVARARAALQAPATHFRLNPRVPDAARQAADAGVLAREAGVPGALELVDGRLAPLLSAGVAYAQDEGSQLVARLAASDGLVLDACAAPGGKSLLLADAGGGRTRVIAADASRRRVRTLAHLVARWRAEEVSVVAADALHPPFRGPFDAVLLDAPCSGLGTLARHPDIRWRLGPNEVGRHAERQRALLEAAAPLVRAGGRLVYATCSVEPEENEGVLAPFLAAHPEFAPEALPDWAEHHRDGAFVRIEPATTRGDAFFAARLHRA